MSFGSTPDAPTAKEQADANKETAGFNTVANRPNIYTPYGSQTWEQYGVDPTTGAGLWNQYVELAPNAQKTVDQTIDNQYQLSKLNSDFMQRAGDTLSKPLTADMLPTFQYGDGQETVNKYANLLNIGTDQKYGQLENQLKESLARKGIPVGSQAYNQAMNTLGQERTNNYTQNAMNAYNVQNQMFNQQYQADTQRSNQAFALDMAPINKYTAIAGNTQVNVPQFQATPAVNMADVDLSKIYQGQLQQSSQENAGLNSLLGKGADFASQFTLKKFFPV